MTTLPRMGERFAGRFLLRKPLAETPGYTAIEALDDEHDRVVDLWLIREELLPSSGQRDLVVRTALEFRDLDHQHIRTIYDADEVQGQVFVAVESASPGGLRRRLEAARPSLRSDIVLYATSIAEALEEGHARGHVHGRLIPEDVVSVEGLIKVGGIGFWADVAPAVARRLWRPADRYLAPEVRESGVLSRGADVYSLAAILVELAAGAGDVALYEATQVLAVEQPDLASVLSPALSPSPKHRPASPSQLLRRIRQVVIDDRVPTQDRPATPPPNELFGSPEADEAMPFRGDAKPTGGVVTKSGRFIEAATVVEREKERELKETLLGYPDAAADEEPSERPTGPRTLAGYAPGEALDRELARGALRSTEPMKAQQWQEEANDEERADGPAGREGSTARSTDRMAVRGPLPGPRRDDGDGEAGGVSSPGAADPAAPAPVPHRHTARMALTGPQPAQRRSAAPSSRATAEAPSTYPDDEPRRLPSEPSVTANEFAAIEPETTRHEAAREVALPPRPPGADAAAVAKRRRMRRVSSLNPLAEAIRAPARDGAPAASSVTMLEGTESAPPRFATAPPRTEVDALRRLAKSSAEVDEAKPPAVGGGELDEPADDDPDTSRRFVLKREVVAELDDPTLTGRRAAPPRPGSDNEGTVPLPLRPVETEEPFDAVNLAALEAELAEVEVPKTGPPRPPPGSKDRIEPEDDLGEDDDEEPTKLRPRKAGSAVRVAESSRVVVAKSGDERRARRSSGGGVSARGGIPIGTIALGLVLAGLLGLGTWYGLEYLSARRGAAAAVEAPDAAAIIVTRPDAAPAAAPPTCPQGMVGVAPGAVDEFEAFCIDVYEHPGRGEIPTVGIRFDDAQATCNERGARLCEPDEWVAACRGPDLATYPYGIAFARDKCNVDPAKPRGLVASGSFAECVSASGAFDMSGNAAEWTNGGDSYGGSAMDRGYGRCPDHTKRPSADAAADDVGFRCCVSASDAGQVASPRDAGSATDAGE